MSLNEVAHAVEAQLAEQEQALVIEERELAIRRRSLRRRRGAIRARRRAFERCQEAWHTIERGLEESDDQPDVQRHVAPRPNVDTEHRAVVVAGRGG